MTIMELLATSQRRIQVSDYFLTQTYPHLNEPKLLLNAARGILAALENLLDVALLHARDNGKVGAYHESLAGKLHAMHGIAGEYGLSALDLHMIEELHELLVKNKEAAVVFPRGGALHAADDEFVLRSITAQKTTTYLTRTKSIYSKIHDHITRDSRLVE